MIPNHLKQPYTIFVTDSNNCVINSISFHTEEEARKERTKKNKAESKTGKHWQLMKGQGVNIGDKFKLNASEGEELIEY